MRAPLEPLAHHSTIVLRSLGRSHNFDPHHAGRHLSLGQPIYFFLVWLDLNKTRWNFIFEPAMKIYQH